MQAPLSTRGGLHCFPPIDDGMTGSRSAVTRNQSSSTASTFSVAFRHWTKRSGYVFTVLARYLEIASGIHVGRWGCLEAELASQSLVQRRSHEPTTASNTGMRFVTERLEHRAKTVTRDCCAEKHRYKVGTRPQEQDHLLSRIRTNILLYSSRSLCFATLYCRYQPRTNYARIASSLCLQNCAVNQLGSVQYF